MALVKPIVNEVVAFDANVGTVITFSANGGDQVIKNEVKIVTDVMIDSVMTEVIVYQNVVTSYVLEQVIPPNASSGAYELTNGNYYRVAVRTRDALNNISPWSNYQPFYCYTTPTLTFNITSGQTIDRASFDVTLTYRQIEDEKVEYALIQLYNANNVLIDSSEKLYNSNTPPLQFDYDILGLENHKQYALMGTVVTVNGTICKTDKIIFYTNYEQITPDVDLTVTLDSCNGYVNLHSTTLENYVGVSNPTPAKYVNNSTMIELLGAPDMDSGEEYNRWARWSQGLYVPTDFLLRVWFYPARQPFKLLELTDGFGENYLYVKLNRGTTEDYLSIRTDSGTVIDQPLGQHCNGMTKVFLWIKVSGSTWDVRTQILSNTPMVLNWNDSDDNLPYDNDADITWKNESFENYTPQTSVYRAMTTTLTSLKISNGVYDNLDITKNLDTPYSTAIPDYEHNQTVIGLNFNGSLMDNSPYYTKMVLKRRDASLLNWITLSEVEIGDNEPRFINFNDSFIPTGIEQTYGLVTYVEGNPTDYYTTTVVPRWGKYFLSDKNNRFVLNYAVIYSNHNQNIQNGVLMPIGATYPIVVQNANGNYRSGSLQFKVLGYRYETDRVLDRVSIKQQTEDILAFLTNGTAKCLTDFNGNIYIFKIVNSPQISYDANWGNGIATISFDWVEQAKYNDYESMLSLGLFDYISD